MELRGTGAIVTGGSRGLGAALGRALAARGARVVLVARGAEALREKVERIRAGGGEAHALVEDVGDEEATHRIAGAAAALAGPIDRLVHDAGSLGPARLRPLLDTDCEDFERALAVNLVGAFRLTKAVAGSMALRGRGAVVHVTSDASTNAYPGWGAYGVSKAALDHLNRCWAAELADVGVHFLAIDPGEMNTPGADALCAALYRHGRAVQYAHAAAPLPLWHVQSAFASRPWASEMPSPGRPWTWELLFALRRRGARFASLTHAAGLSTTGDPALDAALPRRESYEIPGETAAAVGRARARGRRVVAVGTTTVRALESCALERGEVVAGGGEADLVVGPGHRLRAVDAIFTGVHEPGSSHDALLQAFAPGELLARAHRSAEVAGFLGHEFGDSMLVAPGALDGDA